jgi:lysophospholipase L1-like esterase
VKLASTHLGLLLAICVGTAPAAPTATNSTSKESSAHGALEIPATDDGLPGQGPIRRYDWFQNLWKERRTKWAARKEQDRGAIVLLGDSITQGWGEDFTGWFPGMKIANRGISGDTTRGVLIRLQGDVLELAPAAVVLLIGTNDLDEKAEPKTIAENVKLILAELGNKNPKMPILLCQVFPSSASKNRPAQKIKHIHELYAKLVKESSNVTFVETWPLFADANGDAIPSQFPDLLHPNLLGYQRWAAALKPFFATLGFFDTDDYQFTPEPGFVSLFNGKDLSGWCFRPTSEADRAFRKQQQEKGNAPNWPLVEETISLDGKNVSPDARIEAKHGRLIVKAVPEHRRIQHVSTTTEFGKDFILRLEFRAAANADSGVFLRGPQLQCRDYPIAGPYKNLKNYKPGDWNEIEVTVTNNVAFCLCNGEVLESALKLPPSGPIGLEGDRGQMEYRRIRIKSN